MMILCYPIAPGASEHSGKRFQSDVTVTQAKLVLADNCIAGKNRFMAIRRTILTLCLLAMVLVVLVAVRSHKSPRQEAMESLAQFVLDTGSRTWVPEMALRYFGLPTDDLHFHELKAVSESGRTR